MKTHVELLQENKDLTAELRALLEEMEAARPTVIGPYAIFDMNCRLRETTAKLRLANYYFTQTEARGF